MLCSAWVNCYIIAYLYIREAGLASLAYFFYIYHLLSDTAISVPFDTLLRK